MKVKNFILLSICIGAILIQSCKSDREEVNIQSKALHEAVQLNTDIQVHDIFSPPLASRTYIYPSLAAYEAIAAYDSLYESMSGSLNGFNADIKPVEGVNPDLTAVLAYYKYARTLIYSEGRFDKRYKKRKKSLRNLVGETTFKKTETFADTVVKVIEEYASNDNYAYTRTLPSYEFEKVDEGKWAPTPPNYMPPVEPHWAKLRPFTLDSSDQFKSERPTEFSSDKDSKFHKEAKEVYDVVNEQDSSKIDIAAFWDCNPFVVLHQGHVMNTVKKITPGGHWIGIAKLAAKKKGYDLRKTAQTYLWTSIALADGFISCWDEKYRSNYIRPETYINLYMDRSWKPVLQTPPFPEYTSGHSVISASAGTILTDLVGEGFSFNDSTEVKYGLPVRKFDSFKDAYQEAAISRLYGGIHFKPAIENGVTQGKKVGRKVLTTIK